MYDNMLDVKSLVHFDIEMTKFCQDEDKMLWEDNYNL